MNCEELIGKLGFRCRPLGEGAYRLWSPFTYGNDGELVGLYVEPAGDGYLVTDNAASFMHAASMGANLTKVRVNAIRRLAGDAVIVSEGGEIRAHVREDQLPDAIANVLNVAMAVSHYESAWLPRAASAAFSDAVGQVLAEALGDRLKRNVKVTGASGHQIEIPFVVESGSERTYIQPVAYGDDRVEWDYVYRGLGKMLDLKNAGADDAARTIVIDDARPDEELAKAITLLAVAATVVNFSRLRTWAERTFIRATSRV